MACDVSGMNRKNIRRASQAVITILLLILLFRNFSWPQFWNIYQKLPWWFYAVSLVFVFCGQLLYTLKWDIALTAMGARVPYARLLRHYLVATFFNNFLPSAIGGDASKILYLGRREGYFKIGASVFMDRLLGFFSMSLFAVVLFWIIGVSAPALALGRNILSAILAVLIVMLAGANFFSLDGLFRALGRNPRFTRISSLLQKTFEDIRRLIKTWWAIPGAMAIVLAYYGLIAGLYVSYIHISTGVSAPYGGVLASLFSIAVLSNIPISINGIGLREQLHYALFAYLGVSKEAAVGISLLMFSNFLVVSLVGFFVWRRVRRVEPVNMEERAAGEYVSAKPGGADAG